MNTFTAGVERVAPDGDIVFLVGASRKGVQVNSDVLKMSSPVFATNLTEDPGFRARDKKSLFIIELPGDDAEAFITISKLIHHCRIMPTLDEVFGCVDLASKYKLDLPLSATFNIWIKDLACRKDTLSLWKLLICAYKLDHHQAFIQTSQKLLLIQEDNFWELARSTPTFELSFKLAYAHELVRSTVLMHFAEFLSSDAFFYADGPGECDQNFTTALEFIRLCRPIMDEKFSLSFDNSPVETVFKAFKHFKNATNSSASVKGVPVDKECACEVHCTVEDFCEFARDRADHYEGQLVGISLQDFKKETIQEFDY